MKAVKFFALILFACLPLIYSCKGGPAAEGKPFDELTVLEKGDILAFFKAIPAKDLPDKIATEEQRESYFEKFRSMSEDGALADGEGYAEHSTDNVVFWSDYLDDAEESPVDYDAPHPYANLYVYSGAEEGKLFGVLKTGDFTDEGKVAKGDKYYWYDSASGKMSPAKLSLEPAYTQDDLTADPLITYGSMGLYYALKNGGIDDSFYDSGMEVYIEEVGRTGVIYEWNGVGFKRVVGKPLPIIYSWGFSNLTMGCRVPYDVNGYTTNFISADEYEHCYTLVKNGNNEPTLVLRTGLDDNVFSIEVCSADYCNVYGIYPGMPLSDFLKKVNEIGDMFPEPPYIYYNDVMDEEYVVIFTGIDEDYTYKVSKSYYLGDNNFSADAVVSRVCVTNAVG